MVSEDFTNQTIASICAAGGVTITWTITDLCSTTTSQATFSVVPPNPVTPAAAQNLEVNACDYDNDVPATALADLNADLAAWVADQTAALEASVAGEGCSPVVSEDFTNQTIASICAAGGVTITWTITDLCSTTTSQATFSVVPPNPVTPAAAQNLEVNACDYDNDVPATALADLNADLAAWVADQTAALEASVAGEGCSPVVSEDFTNQTIASICAAGGVTITWTITDLCSTTTSQATFSVVPPNPVTPAAAQNLEVNACDYDNDVPATALADLNADLAARVADQTAALEASVAGEGCSPVVSEDFTNQTIASICAAGGVTITWTITDLCSTTTSQATFSSFRLIRLLRPQLRTWKLMPATTTMMSRPRLWLTLMLTSLLGLQIRLLLSKQV